MGQSLTDIGDGEELIDTKVGGVHLTDSRIRPSQICHIVYDMGFGLLTRM